MSYWIKALWVVATVILLVFSITVKTNGGYAGEIFRLDNSNVDNGASCAVGWDQSDSTRGFPVTTMIEHPVNSCDVGGPTAYSVYPVSIIVNILLIVGLMLGIYKVVDYAIRRSKK